jgi:hypothetical protein
MKSFVAITESFIISVQVKEEIQSASSGIQEETYAYIN